MGWFSIEMEIWQNMWVFYGGRMEYTINIYQQYDMAINPFPQGWSSFLLDLNDTCRVEVMLSASCFSGAAT